MSDLSLPPLINLRRFSITIPPGSLVAESASMLAVRESIPRLAAKDAPIFLSGENGTGKAHMARLVHAISKRSKGPYLSLHCAELPEALLEYELFGYHKSACAAVPEEGPGLLEVAAGGVVYLEEINWLPRRLQVKLERAISLASFSRAGSDEQVPLACRLILSASEAPDALSSGGQMEAALLQIISQWDCMRIPPLRERMEDLHAFLLRYIATEIGAADSWSVEEEALHIMQEYAWPGNLAELQAFARKAIANASGEKISAAVASALLAG
jgi:DNA-binding NtrC family response regulator